VEAQNLVSRPKGRTQIETLLAAFLMLVSCSSHSSTLKMEICSSEMSVHFSCTTRLYFPEDRNLHSLGFGRGLCLECLNMKEGDREKAS
jgi:hypothetical protein